MRDRIEQWLRLAILGLLGLVAWQIAQAVFEANPLRRVSLPAIPTLATNAVVANGATNRVGLPGTNGAVAVINTNRTLAANPPARTNKLAGTNLDLPTAITNTPPTGSNAPVLVQGTNIPVGLTNAAATNRLASGTNAPGPNAPGRKSGRHPGGPGGMMMMMGGGFPGMGGPGPKLPPEAQARVDKIVNSEIFAPVFHPLPMALMGIAGDTAFLRGPDGQTGLVKPGDSLGEIKLLRIGINRVLVEQGGEKKELLIFDGYGGESLLSTTNGSSK